MIVVSLHTINKILKLIYFLRVLMVKFSVMLVRLLNFQYFFKIQL